MRNQQIGDIFNEMADIMEIIGEDHFRISTYRKVARVIHDCPQDVSELASQKELRSLPGIGESSAKKIDEFVQHGTIQVHEKLLKKIPPRLLDLLKIPGFGPKGVATVWKKLNVENIADLQRVIDDRSLEALPGFGAKKAESLAHGIKFLASAQGRILLVYAVGIAEAVAGQLRQRIAGLKRIELA
ncbi:MAG: hypothetical protein KAJ46_05985, partial [Sedimentisphaerales bacterium]|nr:hypothetical protein [Sedimentisphaerales bacterium]